MGVELEVITNPILFVEFPGKTRVPDRFRCFVNDLEVINRVLASAGHSLYTGPSGGEPFCLRINGAEWLSTYTCELAVGRWGVDYFGDVLQRYAEVYPPGTDPTFQHLATASVFIPVDFPRVLDTGREWQSGSRYIGSALRLKAECEQLADIEGFPLARAPYPDGLHEEVWHKLYSDPSIQDWCEANDTWHMLTCSKLHYGASYAIRTNGLMLYS